MSNRNQRCRQVWPSVVVVAVLAALFSVPPDQARSAPPEVGTCVAGADPAASWEKQESPVEGDQALNSVFFLDETTGWAVGDGRTILRTVNGGTTYESPVTVPSAVPPSAIFNDVFFLDQMNGWVAGVNKLVLRTNDGGRNWQKVELPQSWAHIDLFGVWFTDPQHGYFVGGYSDKVLIYEETATGGAMWTQSAALGESDTLRHVTFLNRDVGFASGDRGILRTDDAGRNWVSPVLPGRVDFVEPAPALGFTDIANGYALGGHQTRIWRTGNGGDSWDLHSSCPGPLVRDLAFVGGSNCIGSPRCNGIAVGGAEGAISIFGTSDGGATWVGQQLPPGAQETVLRSVAYPTANTAYAVGQNGTIFRASIGLLPVVTGISPARGVSGGGTLLTIKGRHLKSDTGPTRVSFDGVDAVVKSATQETVEVEAPPHPAGTAEVRVVTPAGTSLPVAFEYVPALVSAVQPNEGPVRGGTGVTIRGDGFTGSLAVRFGGQLALGFTVSPDGRTIQATAPPPAGNAPGPVTVSVVNPFGASEAATAGADTYTYLELPAVKVVSPQLGPAFGGTAVTITGTGLEGATEVRFGDVAATTFSVDSPGRITATVPPRSPGAVPVTVTTPKRGTSTSSPAPSFTYHPGISGIFPPTGPTRGGTVVTIAGKGFAGTTEVRFGGEEVTFTERSDTELVAVAPSHVAPEAVRVRVVAAGLSSLPEDVVFTYGVVAGDGDGRSGRPGGGTLPDSTPPAQAAPPSGTASPSPSPSPTPNLSATPSPAPGPSPVAGASPNPGASPTHAPSSANPPVGAGLPPVAPAPVAAPGGAAGQGISSAGQGGTGPPDEDEPRGARRYAMSDASATLALGGAGATACFSWLALARRGAARRRRASPAGRARPKGAY